MLEEFINPSAAQRLRRGVLGDHVEDFCRYVEAQGYSPATIRTQLWVVGSLARWMTERGHGVGDLNADCIVAFVDGCRGRGRSCRGLEHTGLMLLGRLRSVGAVPRREVAVDDSPCAALLADYNRYLCQERAVTAATAAKYLKLARALLDENRRDTAACIDSLDAGDVRDFQLAQTRQVTAKRAQYIGSALRSFLRFLFARGYISSNLALAVLSVRRQRNTTVPRHMSPEDIERLLQSCDRSSATGRRDYAILLLLARLGLRASEVTALELDDVRWREGEIIVRGKGLVRDRVPLLADVGEALVAYLESDRPQAAARQVFLCRKAPQRGLGHPSTVSTIVRRALKRAGLSPAMRGAHLLRHSLATAMVRRGASLAEVGQVLRHRSPQTTEIYAKLDFGSLRDIALPWPTIRGAQ